MVAGRQVMAFVSALSIVIALAGAMPGHAQSWKPQRPIEVMVGAAPGGSIDLTARLIQRVIDERKLAGVTTVVVNRPGAGQGIAWAHMLERAKSNPAIAIGGPNLVSNPITGLHSINHNDVNTLAVLFDDYMAFAVRADSPLKSMRDVIERLRKDPAALSIAIAPSIGSGAHSGALVALRAAGVPVREARFVVYKAAGESIVALLGGDIDVVSGTVANFPAHLQSGRLRLIGVTAPVRLPGAMAAVPTLREQGFDGVYTNWRSVIGPPNMPREQVMFWEETLAAVNRSDEWRRDLERNYWTENFLTGEPARKFVADQALQFRAIYGDLAPAK
ncbi:MAG: tripartite tricarboxylate transporter substrate binding protein [Proteobacteria bacterium]|nr:tripartite tricarboxylate transporter substrate binding protein [Burkholderiales bacterium]